MRGWRLGAWLLAVVFAGGESAAGDRPGDAVVVALKDGSRLVGVIVREDEATLAFRTSAGIELQLARDTVDEVKALSPASPIPAAAHPPSPPSELSDPNDTRLMLAPSGRPLRKGDGYLSDHYVVFPGFAYGLTDHLSASGGFSILPGLNLKEQVFYVSSSAGWRLSSRTGFSIGGLYATSSEASEAGALLFGVGSFGSSDRSLSLGLGLGATRNEETFYDGRGHYAGSRRQWSFKEAPLVMVGGTVRIGRRLSFVTESWLLLGKDFRLSEQPLGAALRFFGDRLSVDVGIVLVADVLDEGFPLPWLSFTYHFGPSRHAAKRRAHGLFGLDRGQPRRR